MHVQHPLPLLADAGHNLSDVAGLVLAWEAALASKLRPDERRTYGWQRGTILAAFANALLLLVAMGALIWEAVGRLTSPDSLYGRDPGRHRELFKQSLHLLFDGVPDSIDPVAVHEALLTLPGVTLVTDLHVWAMSTSSIALTAHLVHPEGHPADDFYRQANELLHDRFEITHVTLQVARQASPTSCSGASSP